MASNPVKKYYSVTLNDYYNDYKKAAKKSEYEVRSIKDYRSFVFDFFAECFRLILEKSWHFVLPFSMGEFHIVELKHMSNKPVFRNRRKSLLTGKDHYISNKHTFGKFFKFKWEKYNNSQSKINSKYYNFKLEGAYIDGVGWSNKYRVGRKFINEYYRLCDEDPSYSLPNPTNTAQKQLKAPVYE